VFIGVLSVLVFVHELGHFWVAKWTGLKPAEFGWGFPPRAFGFYKTKEGKWKHVIGSKDVDDADDTIYSVNWLPIGGFVKLGEDDEPEDSKANHFNNKAIWQRALILVAGVTMNIVLAAVLLSVGYMIGLPQVLGDLGDRAVVTNQKVQIVEVYSDSPADKAGIKIGDTVTKIGEEEIDSSKELQERVEENFDKKTVFTLIRGGETISKEVVPEIRPESEKVGVGIGIADTGLVRYPFFKAIGEGIKTTIYLMGAIIMAFYSMIRDLVAGNGVSADIAGPVGIASLTGEVARMGFVYLLQFAAILSINLAIINGLPFPALDGGRILFLFIEKLKGSPVKKEIEGTIHYIGFALLMLLVLVVTVKDVSRYMDFFKDIWVKIF